MNPNPTIGVFDSGFGGLTVLRALLPLIPNANYIYLGDTARLPYGSKSHETIARYAVSSARFLHEQGAELLVIACNTATALALEDIQLALPIPVIGVVEPGAQAANRVPHVRDGLIVANMGVGNPPLSAEATKDDSILTLSLPKGKNPRISLEPPQPSIQPTKDNGVILSGAKNPRILPEAPKTPPKNHVLVLATTATVQSHAYTHALNALGLEATEKACPLLVPLVEEGWINHPVTDEVLKIYLTEALAQAPAATTLLLGCTHYPLLEPAIHRTLASLGHPLTIIDSAQATAQAVAAHPAVAANPTQRKTTSCIFYATDSVEKFQRLGSSFLGQPVSDVTLIDLGG
ncbi:MAG TPA: aspartate/glutamate racemase family protein [Edaphobacter sp.]|jgi:glutamate racemase|nr:aspartate/glutamate racemase family protein [Edaphobacter sp.]